MGNYINKVKGKESITVFLEWTLLHTKVIIRLRCLIPHSSVIRNTCGGTRIRLPTESFLVWQKPELYKGFAGIVRQPARYNQTYMQLENACCIKPGCSIVWEIRFRWPDREMFCWNIANVFWLNIVSWSMTCICCIMNTTAASSGCQYDDSPVCFRLF